MPETCNAASREREIDGLEVKSGRCQTNSCQSLIRDVELTLTFVAVFGTSTTQRIDPLLLRNTELASELNRSQDASCGQVDVVEGVHQQGIWCYCQRYRSASLRQNLHGWQIMRFFLLGDRMLSTVSAGVP